MKKHTKLIKSHFDKEARIIIKKCPYVIPRYKHMHIVAIMKFPFSFKKKIFCLDMGLELEIQH
jgi:hypothetical protein